MRVAIVVCTLVACLPAWGQSKDEDLALKVQELYRKAKSKNEVEGITLWCRDKIVAMNFKQHEALMMAAIKQMEQNNIEEANVLLKRAKAVDELSANLGDLVCKRR